MKRILFLMLIGTTLMAQDVRTGYIISLSSVPTCNVTKLYRLYKVAEQSPTQKNENNFWKSAASCFKLQKAEKYLAKYCGNKDIETTVHMDDPLYPEMVVMCGTNEQMEMFDEQDI
jgi:hypothetical protein